MSEPSTILDQGTKRGFLQHLGGLFFSPAEEFTAVLPRARFVPALLLLLALNVAFTAVWMGRVDAREFFRAQDEQSARWDQLAPEQREAALDRQVQFFPILGWTSAVLGTPILLVVVSAVYLFVFRFFLASEIRFKRCLAIVTWAFLVVALVTLPLTLASLYLKGDWTLDPRNALQANLTLLLDRAAVPRMLYSLAESLDLFSFWRLFLLFVGFRAAVTKPGVAAGTVVPWGVYVVGRALLAGLI